MDLSKGRWSYIGSSRHPVWSATWSPTGDRLTWQLTQAVVKRGAFQGLPTFGVTSAHDPAHVEYVHVTGPAGSVGQPASPDGRGLLYFTWEGPKHEKYWDLMRRRLSSKLSTRIAGLIVFPAKEGGPTIPYPFVLGNAILCPACSNKSGLGIPYLVGSKVGYLYQYPDTYDYLSPGKPILISSAPEATQPASRGWFAMWSPGRRPVGSSVPALGHRGSRGGSPARDSARPGRPWRTRFLPSATRRASVTFLFLVPQMPRWKRSTGELFWSG